MGCLKVTETNWRQGKLWVMKGVDATQETLLEEAFGLNVTSSGAKLANGVACGTGGRVRGGSSGWSEWTGACGVP